MDKPKYTKRIKCLTVLLLFVFCCSLTYCYTLINLNKENLKNTYNATINEIIKTQSNYSQIKNNTNNVYEQTPVFTNGLDALLSAYEEYDNLQEVEVSISGTLVANAKITSYLMEIQGSIKKVNGKTYSQINVYCATSPDKNSGSLSIFENNIILEQKTKNVSKINGKLVSDFTNCEQKTYNGSDFKNERGTCPGEFFYTVNRKSVTSISNFYIKRNLQGEITGYNTNFTLSPTLGTTKYVKMMQGIIVGSKNYKVSVCSGSLELNENGNLKAMHTQEKYTLDFNLFGDAFWPVECTSSLSFVLNI